MSKIKRHPDALFKMFDLDGYALYSLKTSEISKLISVLATTKKGSFQPKGRNSVMNLLEKIHDVKLP